MEFTSVGTVVSQGAVEVAKQVLAAIGFMFGGSL